MADVKVLSNGVEIPKQGFGVYQINDQEECERVVREAAEVGYRLFDTAWIYGNEEAVGKALENCGVGRKDLFITTKVWTKDMGYDNTKRAFEASLKKLRLDYLDLFLIHEPMGDVYGTWRAMQDLYKEGLIRAIGVCNMWPDRLLDLVLNAEVQPHLEQIETHPFNQQDKANVLLREYGIAHEAWAPFAEGREGIFQNAVLQKIADAHGKSIAQVILRWLYQRDIISLCKSARRERMQENFLIHDFTLTDAEMQTIRLLDHDRPLILNNRDLEVVKRISPHSMGV